MSHTPGPWTWIEGRGTLVHVETRDSPVGDGVPVCSIPRARLADARLISAAPDMLALLEDIMDSPDVVEQFPEIERVVSKARGES